MSFVNKPTNSSTIDHWAPACYCSFEEVQKAYSIESEDWVLHQKNQGSHPHWVIYRPYAAGKYQAYHVGFSFNPESPFYFKTKIVAPIIIKANDEKLLSLVKKFLSEI